MWCEPGCQHSKNSKLLTCTIRCIIYSPNFFVEARECKCSMVANQMQGRRKWGVGGRGAVVPSNFGRSANPIRTGWHIMPTTLTLIPQIFRPSYGPEMVNRSNHAFLLYICRLYRSTCRIQGVPIPPRLIELRSRST